MSHFHNLRHKNVSGIKLLLLEFLEIVKFFDLVKQTLLPKNFTKSRVDCTYIHYSDIDTQIQTGLHNLTISYRLQKPFVHEKFLFINHNIQAQWTYNFSCLTDKSKSTLRCLRYTRVPSGFFRLLQIPLGSSKFIQVPSGSFFGYLFRSFLHVNKVLFYKNIQKVQNYT